jgi:hypothetical protein
MAGIGAIVVNSRPSKTLARLRVCVDSSPTRTDEDKRGRKKERGESREEERGGRGENMGAARDRDRKWRYRRLSVLCSRCDDRDFNVGRKSDQRADSWQGRGLKDSCCRRV